MNIEKISWKLFFKDEAAVNPELAFKVFNKWIPNSPEIFVDVADYKHVQDGPLTLLYGHYVDYFLDVTDGKLGLAYARKRGPEQSYAQSLQEFLKACQRFVGDPEVKAELKLDELIFIANDRGLAPNNDKTQRELMPSIQTAVESVLGEVISSSTESDPNRRFSIHFNIETKKNLAQFS